MSASASVRMGSASALSSEMINSVLRRPNWQAMAHHGAETGKCRRWNWNRNPGNGRGGAARGVELRGVAAQGMELQRWGSPRHGAEEVWQHADGQRLDRVNELHDDDAEQANRGRILQGRRPPQGRGGLSMPAGML